ncbi:MAG: hypothetical protein PW788_09030 [Micavibrio sp.]|nr:hypothetical protein [Micavibrio sp.]
MTDHIDSSKPPVGPPQEDDKVSVITVNFKDGHIISKVQFDGEGGIPKFLRDMAKFAKQTNVKSVVIMTINNEEHVDWVHIADSEHHLALAALCLDDIKDDLKSVIFKEEGAED